jgi:iron complex outermembrane recepter protein
VIQRFISGGTFNNNYIQCTYPNCPLPTANNPTINYNHVASVTYLDLGGTYNLTEKAVLYAKVNNITNVPPQMTSGGPNITGIYDVIGRMYYVGFRFNTN